MTENGAALTLSDSVHDRLLRHRVVVLGKEVDDDVANRWFSPDEAREYGFIDRVL